MRVPACRLDMMSKTELCLHLLYDRCLDRICARNAGEEEGSMRINSLSALNDAAGAGNSRLIDVLAAVLILCHTSSRTHDSYFCQRVVWRFEHGSRARDSIALLLTLLCKLLP